MPKTACSLETILYRISLLILNHRAFPRSTVYFSMPTVHSTTFSIWPTILFWNSTTILLMSLNSVGICLTEWEEFISIAKITFKYGYSVAQKWSTMVIDGGSAITAPRLVMGVWRITAIVSNVFLAININQIECPVLSRPHSFRQNLHLLLLPIQPISTWLHPTLLIATQVKILPQTILSKKEPSTDTSRQ